MGIKFGNLSPEAFAAQVGATFTQDELAHLHQVWSQQGKLVGPEDFHVFDDPAISIHVGSVDSRTVEVFQAANARTEFNRPVQFYLDDEWATGA